jgi:hypothetical protein
MTRPFLGILALLSAVWPDPAAPSPMTAANRTSGIAPLSVFFDAVDTPVPAWTSGVVQPPGGDFAPFDYRWDFGEKRAEKWSVSGKSRNHATGYVAAHVFEEPGRYRVLLTVTDAAGRTYDYAQDIEVLPFSGSTRYVSSSMGSDFNNGESPEAPFKTINQALQGLKSGTRVLFKRGDSFETIGAKIDPPGPGILGAYGTGNKPLIRCFGTDGGFNFNGSDWRLMDLELVGPGEADQSSGIVLNPEKSIGSTLFLRLAVREFRVGLGWSAMPGIIAAPHDGNTIADCTVLNAPINGIYAGGRRLALLGNTVQGIKESHAVRLWQAHKAVFAHNDIQDTGGDRHALKLHSVDHDKSDFETRFVLVSDNSFRGKAWCVAVGAKDRDSDERPSQVVLERNRFVSDPQRQVDLIISANEILVRNNLFLATGSSKYYTMVVVEKWKRVPVPTNIRIVHNTIVRTDPSSDFCGLAVHEGLNITFQNNLMVAREVKERKSVLGFCPGLIDEGNLLTDKSVLASLDKGDYTPAAGSPAIGAGKALPQVREDFNGEPRPAGRSDLGCFRSGR